jgi:large subunit ribosomal protein L24
MQIKTKDPRKQRKILFNAPAHMRHKLMAAPLTKESAKKNGVKTMPIRKGDTVKVQRGDHKGFEGKVNRVDLRAYRIYIEGLTREKVDGSTKPVAVHPSKVAIKTLGLDDKRRKAVIARKQASGAKTEAKEESKVQAQEETPEAQEEAAPKTKKAEAQEPEEEEQKTTKKRKTAEKTEGEQ